MPRNFYRLDPATGGAGERVLTLPGVPRYGSGDWVEGELFPPYRNIAFDPAGRAYTTPGDGYRIEVLDSDGTLVRAITRVYEPVRIRDRDIARLKSLVNEFYDTTPGAAAGDPGGRERVIESIDRRRGHTGRSLLAPLGRMLLSHDGSFWIERRDAADPASVAFEDMFGGPRRRVSRATVWDLFDTAGHYLGTVELDASFRPMAVRGIEVTGVLTDDLDVEYVATYRVVPPPLSEGRDSNADLLER